MRSKLLILLTLAPALCWGQTYMLTTTNTGGLFTQKHATSHSPAGNDPLEGYVTNNQSGVAFGAVTGTTVSVTSSYTGGFMVGTNAGGIFVPRDTAAAYDYTIGAGLTADSSYRTLDISSIVPSGAKAVTIRAYIKDNLSTSVFLIRKDNTAGVVGTLCYSSVINTYMFVFAPVQITSSRTVEYTVTSGADEAGLVITGWFL